MTGIADPDDSPSNLTEYFGVGTVRFDQAIITVETAFDQVRVRGRNVPAIAVRIRPAISLISR
jgi:hypothetical protein